MEIGRQGYAEILDCSDGGVVDRILKLATGPSYELARLRMENRAIPEKFETVALQYFRYGIGGAEKVTHELMRIFLDMGMKVILYTDERPSEDDYPVPTGGIRKTIPYSDGPQRARYWMGEVREEHIDAMVYNSWHAPTAIQDCLAIQAGGAAFLYHTHSNLPYSMMVDDPDLPRRLEALGCIADSVLVLSRMDLLYWRAFSENVIPVVNPVDGYLRDVPVRSGLPEGKTVLYVGRMSHFDKRPLEALRVFAALQRDVRDARLVMVGDGPDLAAVKEEAMRLGVAECVEFVGSSNDPMAYYRAANACVITSSAEGFPLVLSEAMCQGVPVVMYDLPHLALLEGENGTFRVPWGDVGSAAARLRGLLTDRALQEKCSRLQRSAYERICQIDLQEMWGDVLQKTAASLHGIASGDADRVYSDASLVKSLMKVATFDFHQHMLLSSEREEARKRELQDALEGRREEAAEAERLRRELDEVYTSRSFQIGSKVVNVARRVLFKKAWN